MIKSKLAIFALVTLPLIASADDTSEIKNTYNTLDEAILAKNGSAAFAQLSEASQAYVENIRDLALNADKSTLSQEPITTILSVFSIRKEAKGQAPGSAADTLVLMSGDYSKMSSMVSIGEVTVDGDQASAQMMLNGSASPMDYAFVHEDGAWKIDLIQQMEMTEKMMDQSIGGSSAARSMMLEQMANASQADGVNVWKPLQ